jgi:hypothetical protein
MMMNNKMKDKRSNRKEKKKKKGCQLDGRRDTKFHESA